MWGILMMMMDQREQKQTWLYQQISEVQVQEEESL
jgi:hypothetical protein